MQITLTKLQKKNFDQLYPKLVSELIHKKYSLDDELALLNNHNADPETYQQEYAKYQAYRAEVKQALKEAAK